MHENYGVGARGELADNQTPGLNLRHAEEVRWGPGICILNNHSGNVWERLRVAWGQLGSDQGLAGDHGLCPKHLPVVQLTRFHFLSPAFLQAPSFGSALKEYSREEKSLKRKTQIWNIIATLSFIKELGTYYNFVMKKLEGVERTRKTILE